MSQLYTSISSGTNSGVLLTYESDPGVSSFLNDSATPIGRTVIDNNDFKILKRLAQHGIESPPHIRGLIV